jgi:ribosomal protein L44E
VPNRQLSTEEREQLFAPLLESVRERLSDLSEGDDELRFALNRKLFKELSYDERGKPMQRKKLKIAKRLAQAGKCTECGEELPENDAVLDRLSAMPGYTSVNTRLICRPCDLRIQGERGFA